MILDTEVDQMFRVVVTLDVTETPPTSANGVHYLIKPDRLVATWVKVNNDPKWHVDMIRVRGPRILKGDLLSDAVSGSKHWTITGDHKTDPPSWVLSIIGEIKPNGWELTT
jgi:hypothetical protein